MKMDIYGESFDEMMSNIDIPIPLQDSHIGMKLKLQGLKINATSRITTCFVKLISRNFTYFFSFWQFTKNVLGIYVINDRIPIMFL